MAKEMNDLLVALDVGTSKVVALVAELTSQGELRAIGLGQSDSKGVKKGVVVNIDNTVESIEQAVSQAEIAARCKVKNVYVGICGSHVKGFNSTGMVAVKDGEVSASDVARVIETAKTISIPHDQQILHVIPQEFIIDGNDDVREPIGMNGKRLEVRVHIATGAVSSVQNQVKCLHRQNLTVSDLVFQPFASAEAVLTEDEKEFGVVFVDIGGGTTDIAIFTGGAVRYTTVIPVAGDQVTSDIAMGLRTPSSSAEELKIRHGVAMSALTHVGEFIDVPGVADHAARREPRETLARIIEARLEELFGMVQEAIDESELRRFVARGIVLTGGTAQLNGIVELAAHVFQMPVRVGVPTYTGPLEESLRNTRYATAYGLLLEGQKQSQRHSLLIERTSPRGLFWQKVKAWFVGNF